MDLPRKEQGTINNLRFQYIEQYMKSSSDHRYFQHYFEARAL